MTSRPGRGTGSAGPFRDRVGPPRPVTGPRTGSPDPVPFESGGMGAFGIRGPVPFRFTRWSQPGPGPDEPAGSRDPLTSFFF
ncbi:hypothetical protein KY289_027119 [Solanum tuberosum]|nr:hypothetical protein KY289_027119 [Solanum tuberosum]